jgi:hypothetical protein
MSVRARSVAGIGESSSCAPATRTRHGSPTTATQLGTPHWMMAPRHGLTLPSLAGIRDRIEFSQGFEPALALAKEMAKKGWIDQRHLEGSRSVSQVLEKALSQVVEGATDGPWADKFHILIKLSCSLEESYRGFQERRDRHPCLFFTWSNTIEPQYIPLRPIHDWLQDNPNRERLMGSLYQWLFGAAESIFCGFGLQEAKSFYERRKEFYLESREEGADVDLEGEVEFANPSKIVPYIQESKKLLLRSEEVGVAISSISDQRLRRGFEEAHTLYLLARASTLPKPSQDHYSILEDEYYDFEEPVPGLCISHWRDDPIVAWLDESVNESFQSGVSTGPAIIRCFRAEDHGYFLRILEALPGMVKIARGLSEWVLLGEELERESGY